MLATVGSEADLDDDSWSWEMKWDGMRALAYVSLTEQGVRLITRNGNDVTSSYPDLMADLLSATARDPETDSAVLDGEIVAVDTRGRPDFGLLQKRMKLTDAREIASAATHAPVQFMLFDVLELNGHSLTGLPYSERRDRLDAAVAATGRVQVPPRFDGAFSEAFQTSRSLGLEGIMAKRLDSHYAAGRRSRDWVKIKHFRTQEVIVGGWRPGRGNRSGTIGSLLLGVPTDIGLHYVGRVGTGFGERDLTDIRSRLTRLVRKTTPFSDVPQQDAQSAIWVRPSLVAEVEFAEWTATGRLRQPSWRGWRPDKAPDDITIE